MAVSVEAKKVSEGYVAGVILVEHFRIKRIERLQVRAQVGAPRGRDLFQVRRMDRFPVSGGGKREIHSFDYYDRENGICVYTAPSVKKGKAFVYFDPIDKLSPDAQARWAVKEIADQMIEDALRKAGDAADELVLA